MDTLSFCIIVAVNMPFKAKASLNAKLDINKAGTQLYSTAKEIFGTKSAKEKEGHTWHTSLFRDDLPLRQFPTQRGIGIEYDQEKYIRRNQRPNFTYWKFHILINKGLFFSSHQR